MEEREPKAGLVATNAPLEAEVRERKRAEDSLRVKTGQLQAITESMLSFLDSGDWRKASSSLVGSALLHTASEYGFIGVLVEGPVLRVLAHEGVVWDSHTNRAFFEQALRTYHELGYLEFKDFKNLFGLVVTGGKPVIANDPARDPRSGGLPPGHPPLKSFLGVPILRRRQVVGMIGVANRPGGYTGEEENRIRILCQAAGVLYDSYRRRERQRKLAEKRKVAERELRRTYERLRELTVRIDATVEEERRRIAMELHDEFGQALTCLKFDLAWLHRRLFQHVAGPARSHLTRKIRVMSSLVGETMQTVRRMCSSLRPSVLDDLGLPAALAWLARDCQARAGFRACELAISPEVSHLEIDPTRSLALFRIAQELLTNVMRHAQATKVRIAFEADDGGLLLQVSDNGKGIAERDVAQSTSLGLRGVRERSSLLGGGLAITTRDGGGTVATVRIPLK